MPEQNRCEQCGQMFQNAEELQQHNRQQHNQGQRPQQQGAR